MASEGNAGCEIGKESSMVGRRHGNQSRFG
jgi:hypothetical protein